MLYILLKINIVKIIIFGSEKMIIKAPSRIHMSLIDLNGSYRRVDGGIGLALQDPQFILEVEQTESGITLDFLDTVTDEEAIEECREKFLMLLKKLSNILTLIQDFIL